MPQWDYKCDTCNRVETRFFGTVAEREKFEMGRLIPCKPNPKSGKCAGKLHRQLTEPS